MMDFGMESKSNCPHNPQLLEKKKGKKSKKNRNNKGGATSGLGGGISAGEKLLTPSIEYYKNLALQYKKTL